MSNLVSSFPAISNPASQHRFGGVVPSSPELPITRAGDIWLVEGTGTVRNLPSWPKGPPIDLYFTGNSTFVNSSKLILPGSANYTFSPGDSARVLPLGDGVWRITEIARADGRAIVSSWSNNRLAKTGAYPVVSADKGKTIALAGNAFYTLTFNAASGYDSDHSNMVVNEDAGRAKWVAVAGYSNGGFYLWPLQNVFVFAQNNVWYVHGLARWKLFPGAAPGANTVTWYVDAGGLDTNDGLATGSGAFASIQGAVDFISQNVDANQQNIKIKVLSTAASGAGVDLKSVVGIYDFWPGIGTSSSGTLLIEGDTSTLPLWTVAGTGCIRGVNVSGWRIQGFTFNSNSSWINCDAGSHIYVGKNAGTGNPNFGFQAIYTGFLEFVDNFTSLCTAQQVFLYAYDGGRVIFTGNTITLNNAVAYTAFFNADVCSSIISAGNTYAGAGASTSTGTTFACTYGSMINTGGHAAGTGGGANLPGNVAGTATTGWVA